MRFALSSRGDISQNIFDHLNLINEENMSLERLMASSRSAACAECGASCKGQLNSELFLKLAIDGKGHGEHPCLP